MLKPFEKLPKEFQNDEVKYYLKQYMEDFNHDIYYVENIELEKNKLEVYKDGNLVKSTDKKINYLPLLDSYIKK